VSEPYYSQRASSVCVSLSAFFTYLFQLHSSEPLIFDGLYILLELLILLSFLYASHFMSFLAAFSHCAVVMYCAIYLCSTCYTCWIINKLIK